MSELPLVEDPQLLSITRVPYFNITHTNSSFYGNYALWVLLEEEGGSAAAFFGNHTLYELNMTDLHHAHVDPYLRWRDERSSLIRAGGSMLQPPFAAYANQFPQRADELLIDSTFRNGLTSSGIMQTWTDPNGELGLYGTGAFNPKGSATSPSNSYDMVMPYFYSVVGNGQDISVVWVDGNKLSIGDGYIGGTNHTRSVTTMPQEGPDTPFPYTRLATATQVNSTVFSLFHQINSTTFAEDIWDSQAMRWTTNHIDIHVW